MKQTLFALVVSASLLLIPVAVIAQSNPTTAGVSNPVSSQGQYTVQNPLAANSFCSLIKGLLTAAIQIGIPIAVLFIVYAGFRFVMAQGNPEKLAEARKNLMWTIIGIAIFLGAWLLANVIANTVNALQAGSGNSSVISCQ